MIYFILIISFILLFSTVVCIVDNSKFVYELYFWVSTIWILGVLFIKTVEHLTFSMLDPSVLVLFKIAIIIDILLFIRLIFGIDIIGILHRSKLRRLIFHDKKLLLTRDFYWSACERYGIYIASASAYRDCVNGKISVDIKCCPNSGKSPKDHPSYNKFLADAEKIKLQQINELT